MPILQTKLQPPKPTAHVIKRERLVDKLLIGFEQRHRLLLVVAPAGFGKTTLVTSWLQSVAQDEKRPFIAWLSLDQPDSELNRFLQYYVASLARAGVPVSDYLMEQVQSNSPPPTESILIDTLNVLVAFEERVIMVLEDYHQIENPAIESAVAFLIENVPDTFQLCLISRVEPNLPLPRLRARRQMSEIRAQDLRFSLEETAQFFESDGRISLNAEHVKKLEARTEGWVAGLQMAGLSLQGRSDVSRFVQNFAGSDRYVMDYLVDEVLVNLTAERQTFLLQTSILDRFCASLCDHLVQSSLTVSQTNNLESAQSTLDYFELANIFLVPLDEQRLWYRYHHLFQELLQQRFKRTIPERFLVAHERAAEWLSTNVLLEDALRHAITSKNAALIEKVAVKIARQAFSNGRISSALQSIAQAQTQLDAPSLRLQIHEGWLYAFNGQHQLISEVGLVDVDGLSINGRSFEPELMALACGLEGMRAALHANDDQARTSYQQGLTLLESENSIEFLMLSVVLGFAEMRSEAVWTGFQRLLTVFGPSIYVWSKHLPIETLATLNGLFDTPTGMIDFLESVKLTIAYVENKKLENEPGVAWLYIFQGRDFYYKNQLLAAQRCFKTAVEFSRPRGEHRAGNFVAHSELMRVFLAQGNLTEAQLIAERYFGLHETGQDGVKEFVSLKMRLLMEAGQLTEAQAIADEFEFSETDKDFVLGVGAYDVFGTLLLAQARYEAALTIFQHCLRIHKAWAFIEKEVLTLVQIASTLCGLARQFQARPYLEQAIRLGAPLGYMRCFLDADPAFASLLPELRHTAPEFVDNVSGLLENGRFDANAQLIEPLSQRELEILSLIAQGLSNRQIAEILVLSIGTVKKHAANIYGKLDVNSRTTAIVEARALGLLN
ncbi:MAG: LuxR C-terminal-related transcriptional regulator [Chloroflexota bacterium]